MDSNLQVIDTEEAKRFLSIIAPNDAVTFQTFGEGKHKGDTRLSKVLHGVTDENLATLTQLNHSGAGIFFMVNQGDEKGRRTENVHAVRSVFVDLDEDGPTKLKGLENLASGKPRLVVESSTGKYHAYWLVDGELPLDCFTSIQKHFANQFGGDPAV